MWVALANDQSFNDTLTNDIISFKQLGPGCFAFHWYVAYLLYPSQHST